MNTCKKKYINNEQNKTLILCDYIQCAERTEWNNNINSPLIPWSVNPFLQYKSSSFGNVQLKWYISHNFKGLRRFMLWTLTKNRSILRPYNSDFLLTTTCFIPSWIMMNEMGVSSHKGKYSGHLKLFGHFWSFFVIKT